MIQISKRASSFYTDPILVGLLTVFFAGSAFAAGGGDADHDPIVEAA